jgi:hypothetical protein
MKGEHSTSDMMEQITRVWIASDSILVPTILTVPLLTAETADVGSDNLAEDFVENHLA